MRARLSSRVSLAAFLLLSGAAQALTSSEPSKKERLAALPEEERKWLTEYVAPIILPEEEKLYLQLTEPHQREIFKEEFWKRREKDGLTPPLGPGYRQRYENLRNLAATVYEGLQSDAGRMVVRYGEPASVVEFVNCSEVFRQVEVWTYPRSSFNSRQDVQHLFYRPSFGGPRKLWSPITPEREVLQPASCLTSFQDVCVAEANPGVPLPSEDPSCVVARPRSCAGGCRIAQIAEEIRSRQAGSAAELASLFRSPAVLTEDLEKLRARFATISDPKAKPVSVQSPPELLRTARQDAPEPSRKERLAALPEEERKWLTEFIAPIILPEEEKLFLELTEPHEREIFKEEFWKRREKDGLTPPLGPGYRHRYEELRRLAEQTYDGWRQDAGRMVIRFGEPASIERLDACRDTFRDLEIWTYRAAMQAGKGILRHFFYRPYPASARKLWTLNVSESEIFTPNACRRNFEELGIYDCAGPAPARRQQEPEEQGGGVNNCASPSGERARICEEACGVFRVYTEIRARQGNRAGAEAERAQLTQKPPLSTEGVDRLRERFPNLVEAKAKKVSVEGPSGFAKTSTKESSEPGKKERLAALSEEERKWLTEYIAPIIMPEEEKLFLELTEPHQREIFKEEFWKRREKDVLTPPLGPGYRHRYEEWRRLADEKYDGWKQDAGRMVIRFGEPASIEETDACGDTFRGVEIWTYNNLGASGRGITRYVFYRPFLAGPRKLWDLSVPESELFTPAPTTPKSLSALAGNCRLSPGGFNPQEKDRIYSASPEECRCHIYLATEEVRARQGSPAGAVIEAARLQEPPAVSTEGLDRLRGRFATIADAKAKPLSVEGPSSGFVQTSTKPVPSELSGKERLAALPAEERKWMTEFVAPIIMPEEEKLFLELTEPHQREIFKEEFWKRRERADLPPPLGPGYRHRYEELRRLAVETYDGWRQDAGRMVMRYGEPASIDKTGEACAGTFRDLEIWTYNNLGGSGRGLMRHIFYRPMPLAPRKLWRLGVPDSEVFTPGSCRKNFESLYADCSPQLGDPCAGSTCLQACDVYRVYTEIRARQGSEAGAFVESARLLAPPSVSTEGLDQIADRFPGLADPKAKPLSVEGPSSAAAAPASSAAKAPPKASTPAPARRKLSGKEIKELSAQLEQKYRDWLQLVELIITDEERQVFLQIADNYQKDRFIETFWRRRSIDSQGLRTDYQAIHTRRVETAKELFKNLNNDRAKILIINGAPDAMIPIDCQDVYVPIQIWYYDRLESLKSKVYLIFYQPYGVGEYKLWLPLDGEGVLQVGGGLGPMRPGRGRSRVETCMEERTLRQAIGYSTAVLGSGAMALAGAGKLFQPPIVETEGVDQILSMTTELAAGSVPLGLTKLLRFPEQRANKIAVDLSLLIPKSDLAPRELGEEKFYNVDVIGEVVKGERLIDNFKYRFDVPTDEIGSDKIPLTVRRYLYPGEYNLVLKVSDGNQNAEGRISEKLTVPEQPDAPPPLVAAAREEARATVEKAKETGLLPSAISLLPIAKEIATGLQRFETKVAEGIRAVDFYLNGAKVMTKTRPPFDADLNLGPLPRRHTIRVVAYGPAGRAVGEDEYIVNEGREVFRVRILSPEKGSRVSGPTKVVAAVSVPEGKALQKLEFYSNESRAATLYQPPFEQTVNIRSSKSLGYVRVVGTLEDGTVSEDVRYVNAPDYISEVTVDAVELYTTVTEKGRPVAGLQASNFKVYEDGVLQRVESFEYVKNLPLSLGVVVDTSASMLESLPEAQQAALAFLDFSIGPKDRAFTVSFDNEPYLLSKPTNRKDKLFRSLAGMRAEGSTALYDAIIYALYQFTGVKGKKALVLLSDGKDTASKFDFETTLEYVRKAGISIYGIGLKISGTDLEVKYKLNKLAQVTGGQTFYVDSAKNLESVYRQINEDLRSQYLLTYYSTNTGGKDKWRKVEVKVEPANLQARTLSGYYP